MHGLLLRTTGPVGSVALGRQRVGPARRRDARAGDRLRDPRPDRGRPVEVGSGRLRPQPRRQERRHPVGVGPQRHTASSGSARHGRPRLRRPRSAAAPTGQGRVQRRAPLLRHHRPAARCTPGATTTSASSGVGDKAERTSSPALVAATGWSERRRPAPLDCLGIKDDGSLWAWGYNADGQLGLPAGLRGPPPRCAIGSATSWSGRRLRRLPHRRRHHRRQVRRLRRQPVRPDRPRLPAVPLQPGAARHGRRLGAGRRQPQPRRRACVTTALSGCGAATAWRAGLRRRRQRSDPGRRRHRTGRRSRAAPTRTATSRRPSRRTARCGRGATTPPASSASATRRFASSPGPGRRRMPTGRRSPAATASATPAANCRLTRTRSTTTCSRSRRTARCGPGAPTTTGSWASARRPATHDAPARGRGQGLGGRLRRRRLQRRAQDRRHACGLGPQPVRPARPRRHRARSRADPGHDQAPAPDTFASVACAQRPRLQPHARRQDRRHRSGAGDATTSASSARASTSARIRRRYRSPAPPTGQSVACGSSYGDDYSLAVRRAASSGRGAATSAASWATATT